MALVLVLFLAGALYAVLRPGPVSAPPQSSPSQAPEPIATLAFLGSASDPWCATFYDGLEDWCREAGWELITYDCAGWPVSQEGQIEDLIRTEAPDVAVLYPVGTPEEQDQWLELLQSAHIPTVTLSRRPTPAPEGSACHIAPDLEGLSAALTGLIPDYLGQRREVLFVCDLPEDPLLEPILDAFSETTLHVAEYGACWGQRQYAQEYLEWALARHPQTAAIFCLSQEGALGAQGALGEDEEASILCLDCDPDIAQSIRLRQVDAALCPDPRTALEQVKEAATALRQGKSPQLQPLALQRLTAANIAEEDCWQ